MYIHIYSSVYLDSILNAVENLGQILLIIGLFKISDVTVKDYANNLQFFY